MVTEARRLRAAVERNTEFGGPLPVGAGVAELDALRAAVLPRHLPDELLDLLSVMNGTGSSWVTLADVGPLLSCADIVAETQVRDWSGSGIPWCSAWTVISSEQWTFAAVLSGSEPIRSSPVIDLSYGNQDIPVAAASLTALISASADAWERGWGDVGQIDPTWWPEVYAPLTRAADLRYPGTRLLSAGDAVSSDSSAWPPSWPDRAAAPELPHRHASLGETPEGICAVVLVEVVAREGQVLSVTDASGTERVHLPPAFDPEARVAIGSQLRLLVTRRGLPVTRPVERNTLECRGILPAT